MSSPYTLSLVVILISNGAITIEWFLSLSLRAPLTAVGAFRSNANNGNLVDAADIASLSLAKNPALIPFFK